MNSIPPHSFSHQATKSMSFVCAMTYRIVAIITSFIALPVMLFNLADRFLYITALPPLLLLLIYYFHSKVRKPDLKRMERITTHLTYGLIGLYCLLMVGLKVCSIFDIDIVMNPEWYIDGYSLNDGLTDIGLMGNFCFSVTALVFYIMLFIDQLNVTRKVHSLSLLAISLLAKAIIIFSAFIASTIILILLFPIACC